MKLIMLPGADGTGALFQPVIAQLSEKIDVQVISYPDDTLLNYDELGNWLYPQLPKKQDFTILAESFSGPVADTIATRQMSNLKSIIFVATFLGCPNRLLNMLQPLFTSPAFLSLPLPEVLIRKFLLGPSVDKPILTLFRQALNSVAPELLAHRLSLIAELNPRQGSCTVPACYLQATDDKLVSKKSVHLFQDRYLNLTIARVKGPHFILQVMAKVCAAIIEEEIQKHGR